MEILGYGGRVCIAASLRRSQRRQKPFDITIINRHFANEFSYGDYRDDRSKEEEKTNA